MPLLFSSTIDLISREMAKIDRVFKPPIRELDKNLLGAGDDLNMPYAGFSLGEPWTIPLDRYKTIISVPDPFVVSLGPDIIIRDYTRKPRERTKNLYNLQTGRFTLVHIPNLIDKFIEDNQQIFNPQADDYFENPNRHGFNDFERTSKNVRDRFADMFGTEDLQGISGDDPVKVLSLDLRRRLWESWRAGNNQISDIYRIVRRYEGFDLILPEPHKLGTDFGLSQEISATLDQDGFDWETGNLKS